MRDAKGQEVCTSDGRPGEDANIAILDSGPRVGQQQDYRVLCTTERDKGFVRPYRDAYKHVGREVCGTSLHPYDAELQAGNVAVICTLEPGHDGKCGTSRVQRTLAMMQDRRQRNHLGGCGAVTTMGKALAETYARDPSFYGGTFCATCRAHFPVGEHGEFTWADDGTKVGT